MIADLGSNSTMKRLPSDRRNYLIGELDQLSWLVRRFFNELKYIFFQPLFNGNVGIVFTNGVDILSSALGCKEVSNWIHLLATK